MRCWTNPLFGPTKKVHGRRWNLHTPQVEFLESRHLLVGDLIISEFLASNDNGLRDEDQQRSDWVELLNSGPSEVDLDGWFLTDDPNDLDKWKFPAANLSSNERLVVFASDKNRRSENDELHANFRLSRDGDYLALVQPDGLTVASEYSFRQTNQIPDVSFGMPQAVFDSQLVSTSDSARILVPSSDDGIALARDWTEAEFDDAAWLQGAVPIGYERNSGYEDIFSTDLEQQLFAQNTSVYVRLPFELARADNVYSMTLSMQYDDGFVAYVNGQEIARRNAPEDLSWDSKATAAHKDREAVKFEDFAIDVFRFQDLLRSGQNILAVHALNDGIDSSDFLMNSELKIRGFDELQDSHRHFFTRPTPGEPNGIGSTNTIISAIHEPNQPAAEDPLIVRSNIYSTDDTISNVTLFYRSMFSDETALPMADDGQNGDRIAGDGEYAATIPAGIANAGEMIRYRITSGESPNQSAKLPAFTDPFNREEYFGTVVADPSVPSQLPTFQLFLQDPEGANSLDGTRGSLVHDGKFYDNIHIDTSGRTVGLAGPKKSHDIFFTSDHWFELASGDLVLRMNDFDIITDFWNRAKVRVPLAYQTLNDVGTPAHLSFPVRFDLNGEFYGTFSFVDGGNERFLDRAGLNPTGALYKMNLGFSVARGASKKQTREFEDTTDLREFFRGLSLSGEARKQFLFDHVNIPATINYLAGLVIMGHGDCCGKNLYLYRDTEGTQEWQPLPWDVDSAFGRGGVGRSQSLFPTAAPIFTGINNSLFRALMDDIPEFRSMYLRRLRTLMDEFIQMPDTPADQLHFENRIDTMVEQLAADAALDFEKWGSWYAEPGTERVVFSSENVPTWQEEVALLKDEYFPTRRRFLYNSLKSANGGEQLPAQIVPPSIEFGRIDFDPESGNQAEEYIEIKNPNDFAVDISGWKLAGGVSHTFHPGTVIPAGGTFFVSPNVNAFRARATGPSGGQSLLVQGTYEPHISNHGTTIQLYAADESIVAQVTTPNAPNSLQQFLRISELMYHPRIPEAGSRFVDNDFEFVELVNTSTSQTINLENVVFSEGIQFTFPAMLLLPGERAVVVRDQDAFVERYGTEINVVGEYGRTASGYQFSNRGENILLEIAAGDPIHEFFYSDRWIRSTDGAGFSLTFSDPSLEVADWNIGSHWKASSVIDGTPGRSDTTVGDVNKDGNIDELDIQRICAAIHGNEVEFDLDGDQQIDRADLAVLIEDILATTFGDADLSGQFNSRDLVLIFQQGEYEDQIAGNSTWTDGDWNCDGEFDSSDLVTAFQAGGYSFEAFPLNDFPRPSHRLLVSNIAAFDFIDDETTKQKRR